MDRRRAEIRANPGDRILAPRRVRVALIVTEKFTLSAFALFVDGLRLASDRDDLSRRVNCDWELLAHSRNPVRSSCGVEVTPTGRLRDPQAYDYVVLVGGLLGDEDDLEPDVLAFLSEADKAGVFIIGLCTASFRLTQAGFMKGRAVCVSWLHQHEFRRRFPETEMDSSHLFLWGEGRATCAGGLGAADLVAHLIRQHLGAETERKTMRILQIGAARGPDTLQPYLPLEVATRNPRVIRALSIMEQTVSAPLAISNLARRVGMGRRQFERLFKETLGLSPRQTYVRIRMAVAQREVAESQRTMTDIALDAGFDSASAFSRSFRLAYGISPSGMRKANGSGA